MSNKCIHLKQKLNRKLECKKDKNRTPVKDCTNCPFKEYKCTINRKNCAKLKNKSNNNQIKKPLQVNDKQMKTTIKMKNKSNKLAKLERNRTSLFTDDMEHCIICGKKKEHIHEIYQGRNRRNSMKFKLCLPLCSICHTMIHNDSKLQKEWHIKGQLEFIKHYPDLKFEDIFRRNYLSNKKRD